MRHTRARILILGTMGVVLAGTVAGWAARQETASPFGSTTIDIGVVASDAAKSVAFYKDAIGFHEAEGFDVPAEFAAQTGLSQSLPFHVHVLNLGEGPAATKLKVMQFSETRGQRNDQQYIHSSLGFRYLTIFVTDLNASLERAAAKGVKPVAQGPTGLPAGFPAGLGLAVLRDPDGNFVELVGPFKPAQ